MTLFELVLLFATAGISGAGFASLCGMLLERIGRQPSTQPVMVARSRRS
jgi:hypothetical protein